MPRDIDFSKCDLQDALDLAILIEEEARERYEEFSKLVGGRYRGDAADVFRTMAASEARHGQRLVERRQRLFGDAPSRVDRSMLSDVEAPHHGRPRVFMSPHQAMEVAIDGEVKAHDFFAQAAAHAQDPEARAFFAELQAEEREHRAILERHIQQYPPGPDIEEDDADEPPAL